MFGGSGAARAALLTAELDAARGHTASLQHVLLLRPGQAWAGLEADNFRHG
jgi:hypothetical protein